MISVAKLARSITVAALLFFRLLYLLQLYLELRQVFLAFVVLALGVSQVAAEGVPVAGEGAESGGEFLQIGADRCGLFFDLQPVQSHHNRH